MKRLLSCVLSSFLILSPILAYAEDNSTPETVQEVSQVDWETLEYGLEQFWKVNEFIDQDFPEGHEEEVIDALKDISFVIPKAYAHRQLLQLPVPDYAFSQLNPITWPNETTVQDDYITNQTEAIRDAMIDQLKNGDKAYFESNFYLLKFMYATAWGVEGIEQMEIFNAIQTNEIS